MRSCLFVLLLPDAYCLSPTNPDLPNAKPSPLWGEGVERSETDEGDVPTGRRLNIRISGRYPPHPSSGFRETQDATFPPEGGKALSEPRQAARPIPRPLLGTSKNYLISKMSL